MKNKNIDYRHIETGHAIPGEGYCDQPYIVINKDRSWTCVMTTGQGREGDTGQHVVSLISKDLGQTWVGPYDIEPGEGPEASWVMPLLVPDTGRIYAFYTYNKDNQREVKTVNGGAFQRVDSLGVYAYRYSDDQGLTWSKERYEIPMRLFECDRENAYGGKVQFFWGVGKPFIHKEKAFVVASKVGGFGPGFFVQNEGVLFSSSNLLSESDPSKHLWQTLPDGEVGLRTPTGGGLVAGELNATPMNNDSLYCTYRTIDGWACHGISQDDGHTWDTDWMVYQPGGRRVKNPRSANFVRRFSNGKYLYWFCFNGGEELGKAENRLERAYNNRNPIWMCGGVEVDGHIHWSQPEIILYDDKIGNRSSYPDFIECEDRIFVSETQKEFGRVHELDPMMLSIMWKHLENETITQDGLLLELKGGVCVNGSMVTMPSLPRLHCHDDKVIKPKSGSKETGATKLVQQRGSFSLELWVRFEDLCPWQVLFDSRTENGLGLFVQLTDRKTLRLTISSLAYDTPGATHGNGGIDSSWECDLGLIHADQLHQVLFLVDGGPKIISVMVDGELCDGGQEKETGWGRFHPNLKCPNGSSQAHLGSSLNGKIECLRLYERHLLSNEGSANWKAGLD